MTENNARIIPTINAVDNFNPADFTRQLPNEDGTMSLYLDVKYRLLWFRLHRPNGKIDSEIIHVDDKSAVVCCKLYADRGDALDQYVAKSSAQRFVTQERFGDRYLETAETAAMGRVLAAAGYGTQFCGAADMFGDIMVDIVTLITTKSTMSALSKELFPLNKSLLSWNAWMKENTSSPIWLACRRNGLIPLIRRSIIRILSCRRIALWKRWSRKLSKFR